MKIVGKDKKSQAVEFDIGGAQPRTDSEIIAQFAKTHPTITDVKVVRSAEEGVAVTDASHFAGGTDAA